ncbi:phage baseplate plug family protein [Phytobacter diazotrophicus]|uniref:phage baseplate plug family protein n=1 Tax=Phytobacter diazotrophicus TaxID=395631 RepID=UPI002FFA99B0
MSTELYTFTGNERESMLFTAVLDGTVYNCQIKWNIAAQRWYLLITDNSGNTILNTPMVGSVSTGGINLIYSVFSSTTLIWREKNGQIEVTT